MNLEKYLEKNCSVLEYMREGLLEALKSQPILMIEEIQKVLQNPQSSDFEKVEQITGIFEQYGVSAGTCHDF